jgi:hypothetical protein
MSCGGALPSDGPGVPGRGRSSAVDPNSCGNYAASDVGRKIQVFLKATVALDKEVTDAANYVLDTCKMMGAELAMSDDALAGDSATVCRAVDAELKAHLQAGVKADSKIKVDYKPAECTVDASVAASAQAACAGNASTGTDGSAADGACASSGQVEAAVAAECRPAEVTVTADARIAVDAAKMERAVKAIKVGLPRLLLIHAKLTGPVQSAVVAWSKSANDLSQAGRSLLTSVGEQVACVSGQIAAAAGMIARVTGAVEVNVSVSVELSASAGASV